MIKTKLAKKVLTKKDQKHLTESGINSIRAMKGQIEHCKKLDPERPHRVCPMCWSIGLKLNLPMMPMQKEKSQFKIKFIPTEETTRPIRFGRL